MQNKQGHYRHGNILAYRVHERRCHPVEAGDREESACLSELRDVLVSPGIYGYAGHVFALNVPGVYRFQAPDHPGCQVAILDHTPSGIASVAAELGTLGNADRNKPWPVLSRIATHSRLCIHCMQFSNLAVFLAQKAGLYARTWLMWNYDAEDHGDMLPSHAITEIHDRTGRERYLYDPSFGVELIVEPAKTDFALYQSARLDGSPITVQPISQGFGYEYGTRFFNPYSDDFDLDALGADSDVLLESHRRLVAGTYVHGGDLAGNLFATEKTQELARCSDLEAEKRDKIVSATTLPQDIKAADPAASQSAYRNEKGMFVGYRIADGNLKPLQTSEATRDVQVIELEKTDLSGIKILSGALWSLKGQTVALDEAGVYRFRPAKGGPNHHAIVYQGDPVELLVNILEATASGTLHDDLSEDDLKLAASGCKAVALGATLTKFVVSVLSLARLPFRVWQIPTAFSGTGTWPLPMGLVLLELHDLEGRARYFDVHRTLELSIEGGEAGFSEFEAAICAQEDGEQKELQLKQICCTPRFGYGAPDRKTGLFPDLLMPLWLGDPDFATALWRDSLTTFPAMASPPATTVSSKQKAQKCVQDQRPGKSIWRKVLEAPLLS